MTHIPETIAVLSDIHGNSWALDAVLEHAQAHHATRLFTLGDHVYGPLDPRGTMDRLMDPGLPALHIAGNQDHILWENSGSDGRWNALAYTRACLEPRHLNWLRSLPREADHGQMHLCHGSPGHDSEYLLEAVNETGLHLRQLTEVIHKLEGVNQEVVLCGHSHLPRFVQIPSGTLIVNPGSVGLQAFSEDSPLPHLIENRSPHARYALLKLGPTGWEVALMAVPYDWEAAAAAAERNHHPAWARVLRSGWA
jgi:putative phosphoesterase